MIIHHVPFRPLGTAIPTTAIVEGETLILNGERIDLSLIPDGMTLPMSAIGHELFAGPVSRRNGEIELTLKLAVNAGAPAYMWQNGRLQVSAGPVPFPVEPIDPPTHLAKPVEGLNDV
ncbi:hypothetical protein SAMN05216475_4031 [Pseudomonas synxantha]|uniref:Uncharacterized protein n=1 Tax=Pseudomonas synxantha TaxID=47883 RepID=A0AAX3IBE9_9PSED|nr:MULTISPECIES: hypothetical protein [Pseudomonas]AZE65541.1 hypothetical protein C4K01_1329 [Pseudomonas synxantha]MDT3228432.1 hypothetical protein [Pseudomonas sp. rhizo25]SDU51115.1 hypothetical protein SAMN05216475_4031 [Pseudomonas synxantha]VTR03812.1 Uncharacterised protein [Pseudomonas synxantha]